MMNYVLRRLLYGVLVLIGVNLLTFALFFAVNTPDDMARLAIGGQRVSQTSIDKWKVERGYDKPLFFNSQASGAAQWTDTIFYARSVPLLRFDFGFSGVSPPAMAQIIICVAGSALRAGVRLNFARTYRAAGIRL